MERRRQKSLRIGVHHADAVVWEPVYRTHLTPRGDVGVALIALSDAVLLHALHVLVHEPDVQHALLLALELAADLEERLERQALRGAIDGRSAAFPPPSAATAAVDVV